MAGHIASKRAYYSVFAALAALTLLTVLVSFVHLPGPLHVAVALVIATTKALLVALIFMHVMYSERLIWVVAGAGLAWLAILLVLTFSDYLSRDWLGYPLRWPGGQTP
jgi:cytochrome c oxidase subunit 4